MRIFLTFVLLLPLSHGAAQETVNVLDSINRLLDEEDTDGDKRITVEDIGFKGSERGDGLFLLRAVRGKSFEVAGTYYLSNLLQELKLAEEAGLEDVQVDRLNVFELPADRISRLIREKYWEALTRRIDQTGVREALPDSKTETEDGFRYLYVPSGDNAAHEYFSALSSRHPDWHFRVVKLPSRITPEYVRSLDGRHGLLSLRLEKGESGLEGTPFVVPGGRFNEMYGWDSYFIVLGLLRDGRVALAKSVVDNFVYQIRHYGAILNANRTYYLTRSQPPFLTSMIRAVYERLPRTEENKRWLGSSVMAAVREYHDVWTHPARMTSTGLSRYFDSGNGPAPEVAEYGSVYAQFARRHRMTVEQFIENIRRGTLKDPELDAYFVHDRAMRESGHDTSYRLVAKCAHLATVDLNSLLYKTETDLAEILEEEFSGFLMADGKAERSADWRRRAEERRERIDRYLWSDEQGMYFDYDVQSGRQTLYRSATTLYPLWAGLSTTEQARRIVTFALPILEMPGGITGSTEESRGPISDDRPQRQWDYPFGWSPHQILAWTGLIRYGYEPEARRLAYRWLYTITFNASRYNGTVPEKFNVVSRSHKVFAEYGNVGTEFSYITREGFGWTNASFQLGMDLLSPQLRTRLNALVPPEWVEEFRVEEKK